MEKGYKLPVRRNSMYKNKKKLVFYLILMLIPVAHFFVFYVYINFNSFALAFTSYEKASEGFLVKSFAGFSNFAKGFEELAKYPYRIKNYFKIDSEYGTDADLKKFVERAHELGMKVMLDAVYYHCGPTADIITTNPDFVVRDENGNAYFDTILIMSDRKVLDSQLSKAVLQFNTKEGLVKSITAKDGSKTESLVKALVDGKRIVIVTIQTFPFAMEEIILNNGVAMVHQELNQALKRNVMDNIWLGRYPMTAGIMVNEHKMLEDTNKIFEELGIAVDPKRIMSTMPVSQRQMVEIAKAVSYNSKIIVFDEPTSSLTEEEVEHLFKIINMLRDRGCGIIYISHKMAEILRIADEVTVMRDGAWIATEPAQNLTTDKIIKLMVGRELTNQFPPKTNKPGEVALEVEHLSARYSLLQDVSFKARKGEIVGLAGLDGSGRTETLENIFGVATRKDGVIKLDGKEVRNRNARESIKNGFALLTEERRATGIFGILNIRENTVISSLKKHKKAGFYLSDKSMEKDTAWAIDAMHIKTPSQKTKIRSLSGGNQQKVILGRWLLTEPEVLMLDEPTRGIDVGAKYEIYQLIIDLANKGKVVLMVSSEMPELLGVCDRILVMSGGKLAGEVDAKNTTQEEIMSLAAKYV